MKPVPPPPVTLMGAGFSALSLAYYLVKAGARVELFDEQIRAGGMLATELLPQGPSERAANAFLDSSLLRDMASELGVELLTPQATAKKRYIFRNGKLRRWPLSGLETARLLFGLLRFRRLRPLPHETLAHYGSRVFGPGATHFLLSPAMQGVYGTQGERLSASLLVPLFTTVKRDPKALPKRSVAPREGLGALTRALERWLRASGKATFHLGTPGELPPFSLGAPVVVATSLTRAAGLIQRAAPEVSFAFESVPMLPLTSITAFFPEALLPRGFGVLFPVSEGVTALGCLFNSDIFAERVREPGLRSETYIFGRLFGNDAEALEVLLADRKRWSGRSDPLVAVQVHTWPTALPLYGNELETALEALKAQGLPPGLHLHGNYLGRLGLSQILESSFRLARLIIG